jgi:hypothetical protein
VRVAPPARRYRTTRGRSVPGSTRRSCSAPVLAFARGDFSRGVGGVMGPLPTTGRSVTPGPWSPPASASFTRPSSWNSRKAHRQRAPFGGCRRPERRDPRELVKVRTDPYRSHSKSLACDSTHAISATPSVRQRARLRGTSGPAPPATTLHHGSTRSSQRSGRRSWPKVMLQWRHSQDRHHDNEAAEGSSGVRFDRC